MSFLMNVLQPVRLLTMKHRISNIKFAEQDQNQKLF